MTPNFALSLSIEGLKLLHREAGGWRRIGEVPVDSADLAGELSRLRAMAQARAPEGLRTKLLIPNDQIRYLALDGARDAGEVATALEGTTPYAPEELVVDFVVSEGRTHVAAVARETLDEAEAFAREYELEPVAFAAVPEPGGFPGEVLFGPVAGQDTPITRDAEPVREALDMAPIAEVEATPHDTAPDAEAAPEEPVAPAPAPLPEVPESPAPAPEPDPFVGPEESDPAVMASEPPVETPLPDASDTSVPSEDAAQADPETEAEAEARPEADPVADADADADDDDALLAPYSSAPAPSPKADAPVLPESPPEPPRPEPAPQDDDVAPAEPPRPAAPPVATPLPPRGDPPRSEPTPAAETDAARRIMPPAMPRPGAPPAAMPAVPPAETPAQDETGQDAEAEALAAGAALVAPTSAAPAAQPAPPPHPGPTGQRDRASERERLTVFGARRAETERRPGRLALLAGLAALVLLLVLAGLWFGAAEDDRQAGLLRDTGSEAIAPQETDAQEPEPEPEPVEEAAAAPQIDYDDFPAPDPGPAAAISPAEAERIYAATGVWLRAPRLPLTPRAEAFELPLSVTTEPYAAGDGPRARLAVAAPDGSLPVQAAPPPAGSVFERDARGFIAATAEGTLTPQGLVVFAGRPEVLPPTRPGTVAPPPAATPEPAAETETDDEAEAEAESEEPETEARARPDPPPVVPPTRPDDLAPETKAAQSETATPGGVALDALRPPRRPAESASLAADPAFAPLAAYEGARPPLRPDGLVPDAEAQVTEATDAQAAALAAALAAEPEAPPARASVADALVSLMADAPDPLANATPQAVPTARRPDTRPRNFDRVVARSRPAQSATPTAPQQVANATVAPDGPVPGSVARAATRGDAINLRDINLIGVYGKPGARRALVRLDNGRYLRVGIGDSLDGGRVTAIGDDVLNYVRRGRTLVLQIPD